MQLDLEMHHVPQLKLTPYNLQALEVLTMPQAELNEFILREAEENPFLDVVFCESASLPFSGQYPADERNFKYDYTSQTQKTLQEYLSWQLLELRLPAELRLIANSLVDLVQDSGYFSVPKYKLPDHIDAPMYEIEKVLEIIQNLDPPGVASFSLEDCLMRQLCQIGRKDSLAARIISLGGTPYFS